MKIISSLLSLLLLSSINFASAKTNTATITFDAHLFKRTCDVDLSESFIGYGKVKPQEIINNDAETNTTLNRNITLTLTNCQGPGNLNNSKVIVTGPTEIINGESLFKESGSSTGVGIRLKSELIAKTDGDSVWDLSANSVQNDQFTIVAALSCGDCKNPTLITPGNFKATMLFTVLAY
ncbi:fimbrial protein [Providencia heimbachae]|uniref:fimbrial protein n=1 Tax=Providencia heimbachae TaxID=333962 RepID=UPI0010BE9DFB|nr:fimbrial protein [Providencia heimbachae]QCJ69372.1 fimbrial protein [Providencia heimbachae]